MEDLYLQSQVPRHASVNRQRQHTVLSTRAFVPFSLCRVSNSPPITDVHT